MTAAILSPTDCATLAILKGRAQAAPFLEPAGPDTLDPHRAFLGCGLTVIFTIDKGHWFPNSDWQNCWHLSLSETGHAPAEPDAEREEAVLAAVFPAHLHSMLCLEHRPGSPVHHWRLFFTDDGQNLIPRGEMYTRRGTDAYFRERATAKAALYGEEGGR